MRDIRPVKDYRCGMDAPYPVRTMGRSLIEARHSLGCYLCERAGCEGPVLIEDVPAGKAAVKEAEPPLREWREGAPPRGKYFLDTGKARHKVNVERGGLEWNGEVHPLAFAFARGVLRGPIQEKEEEKGMKVKNGQKGQASAKEGAEQAKKIFEGAAGNAAQDFVDGSSENETAVLPAIAKGAISKAGADEELIGIETREAIRKDLLELAQTPSLRRRSIAPALAKIFDEEIKAARERGHSWSAILRIMQKHGLRVSREGLKTCFEG